jgi:cobaltochelatase CobS
MTEGNGSLATGIELPDTTVRVREAFGFDSDLVVPAFSVRTPHVPDIDPAYRFDRKTTLALLAGFAQNRRVLVQGYHGTGKSTHIDQVASRLNWPCVRVNLDGHITRSDLLGRDAIVLRENQQVTEFREGILPAAYRSPVALVLDEYDAGRPDVMFVIQRVLEADSRLWLIDQSRALRPHPAFRLFATSNTVGLGDTDGLYPGVQVLNQGQMDRWNLVASLDYLDETTEIQIVLARVPEMDTGEGRATARAMVQLAELTRTAFKQGNLSTVMSLRTVITWAENAILFKGIDFAFHLSFLNRCDEAQRAIITEFFQRCFGRELPAYA